MREKGSQKKSLLNASISNVNIVTSNVNIDIAIYKQKNERL